MLNPWMRGETTTGKVLDAIGRGTGIPKEVMEKELAESCRNMRFAFEELPGLIGDLKRQGIRCIVATDNMDTFREYTIPGMKLTELFDDFLISCELGTLKFDVDKEKGTIPFFDPFLSRECLNYEDVVLLDDCVDGGFYAEKGFRIAQVNGPEELREQIRQLM